MQKIEFCKFWRMGLKFEFQKNPRSNISLSMTKTNGIRASSLQQFSYEGPPYAFCHFSNQNFVTSAPRRMGKKSSYIKNISGFSYLHVYTTFAKGAKLKFEKSSKLSHPIYHSYRWDHHKEIFVYICSELLWVDTLWCLLYYH